MGIKRVLTGSFLNAFLRVAGIKEQHGISLLLAIN
jgi:hypothetical protein